MKGVQLKEECCEKALDCSLFDNGLSGVLRIRGNWGFRIGRIPLWRGDLPVRHRRQFHDRTHFLVTDLITPLSLGNRHPSRLMLDAGFLYWFQAHIMIYHIDLGLGVTTGIFRPSVAVGANLIKWSEPGYADFRSWGPEFRVRTDFRFRAFSIGLSASIPIDLFLRFATQDWPVLHSEQDELRIFAAQAAVSVGYWFGPSDESKRK